jgi:hypothetical protein
MLTLPGLNAQPSDEEEEPSPAARRRIHNGVAEAIAQRCKSTSYELHEQMRRVLQHATEHEADTVVVPVATIREWMESQRALNCDLDRYARENASRIDRLHVEAVLMQSSMLYDVFDREATHSQTLETIARLTEPVGAGDGANGANGSVARAAKVIAQLHSGTAELTSDAPLAYFGASVCANNSPVGSEEATG